MDTVATPTSPTSPSGPTAPTSPTNPTGRRSLLMRDRDQGFSLIELLVVVIIVGILAGIAIPVYLNQRKKAVDASLKADLKNAASVAQTLDADPMRLMHPGFWLPQGSRVVTYDLFRRAGFTASPNNVVRISGQPSEHWYRLCAFNPGASTANSATSALIYDSRNGGIQSTLEPCASGWGTYADTSYFGVSYSEYGSPALPYSDWDTPPLW